MEHQKQSHWTYPEERKRLCPLIFWIRKLLLPGYYEYSEEDLGKNATFLLNAIKQSRPLGKGSHFHGLLRLFPQDDDITIDHCKCKGWVAALPPALFRLVLRSDFDIRTATEDYLKSFILDECKEKLIDPESRSRAYIKAVRAKVKHHKPALNKICHKSKSSAFTPSEKKRAAQTCLQYVDNFTSLTSNAEDDVKVSFNNEDFEDKVNPAEDVELAELTVEPAESNKSAPLTSGNI
eukprot:scaffold1772_cov34-Cyclotella_meneghiniana.AAC.3